MMTFTRRLLGVLALATLACSEDEPLSPCEQNAADWGRGCQGTPLLDQLQFCEKQTDLYVSVGCGEAWQAYLDCGATSELTCTEGYVSCDAEQQAYFDCSMAFSERSGCSSLGRDERCSGARPYLLNCSSLAQGPPLERCAALTTAGEYCCSA